MSLLLVSFAAAAAVASARHCRRFFFRSFYFVGVRNY